MEDYFCCGVDTFIINLINNWPNNSDKFILICNKKHTGLKLIKDSLTRSCQIIVHKIIIFTGFFEKTQKKAKIDFLIEFVLKLFSPVLRYLFLIYNIFALKKLLLKLEADQLVVVNNGYPAGDSCRAATISWGLFSKKPLSVHNFHGIVLKPGFHIKIQEYLVDCLVSHFTRIFVSVSKAAAETMYCREPISNKNKIHYIHSGIQILNEEHKTKDIKTDLRIPISSQLCLSLGAYHYNKNFNKGHYFLLKSFKKVLEQIPTAHLLFCGYGSSENIDRFQRLVLELKMKDNIHLSGFRNDVHSILKQTDILLIGSQTFESFCLVSIEAMAHGVPVVATKVGAIPEVVIDDQVGYCVEKDDVDSYSGKIIKLLKNENLRIEQGKRGFQRYKDVFTGTRMSKEYSRLIHNEQ